MGFRVHQDAQPIQRLTLRANGQIAPKFRLPDIQINLVATRVASC